MKYIWGKIPKKMIKAVIFDMDGVLVNNTEAHIEAFIVFCRRYGVDLEGVDISWMYGKGNDEIIPRMLPPETIEKYGLRELSDEKEAVYRELYSKSIEPVAGLVGFLEDLRKNDILCSVGSSAPQVNIDFVLDKLDIRRYFSVIVNGDMVKRAKPDPEIYQLSVKKLELQPSECIVMEDSFAGIESGRGAGIKVIALATSNSAELLSSADVEMIVPDFTSLNYKKIAGM